MPVAFSVPLHRRVVSWLCMTAAVVFIGKIVLPFLSKLPQDPLFDLGVPIARCVTLSLLGLLVGSIVSNRADIQKALPTLIQYIQQHGDK